MACRSPKRVSLLVFPAFYRSALMGRIDFAFFLETRFHRETGLEGQSTSKAGPVGARGEQTTAFFAPIHCSFGCAAMRIDVGPKTLSAGPVLFGILLWRLSRSEFCGACPARNLPLGICLQTPRIACPRRLPCRLPRAVPIAGWYSGTEAPRLFKADPRRNRPPFALR